MSLRENLGRGKGGPKAGRGVFKRERACCLGNRQELLPTRRRLRIGCTGPRASNGGTESAGLGALPAGREQGKGLGAASFAKSPLSPVMFGLELPQVPPRSQMLSLGVT